MYELALVHSLRVHLNLLRHMRGPSSGIDKSQRRWF